MPEKKLLFSGKIIISYVQFSRSVFIFSMTFPDFSIPRYDIPDIKNLDFRAGSIVLG